MSNEHDNAGKIVSSSGTEENVERKAKNKSKKAQMRGWEADLRVLGNPAIQSKATATLQKCGSILDGDWRISSVKHEISGSGYTCSLKLVRPEATATAENTVASGADSSNSGSGSINDDGNDGGGDGDIIVNLKE